MMFNNYYPSYFRRGYNPYYQYNNTNPYNYNYTRQNNINTYDFPKFNAENDSNYKPNIELNEETVKSNSVDTENRAKDTSDQESRELCFGPLKICGNEISVFGLHLDIDTIIILGLILFLIYENTCDISLLIVLGLLFLN